MSSAWTVSWRRQQGLGSHLAQQGRVVLALISFNVLGPGAEGWILSPIWVSGCPSGPLALISPSTCIFPVVSGATNSPKHSSMGPPEPPFPSLPLCLEKATTLFPVIAGVLGAGLTLKITSPGGPGPASVLVFSSLSHKAPPSRPCPGPESTPSQHLPSLRPHFQGGLQNQVDPSASAMVSWLCKGPERKYFQLIPVVQK